MRIQGETFHETRAASEMKLKKVAEGFSIDESEKRELIRIGGQLAEVAALAGR